MCVVTYQHVNVPWCDTLVSHMWCTDGVYVHKPYILEQMCSLCVVSVIPINHIEYTFTYNGYQTQLYSFTYTYLVFTCVDRRYVLPLNHMCDSWCTPAWWCVYETQLCFNNASLSYPDGWMSGQSSTSLVDRMWHCIKASYLLVGWYVSHSHSLCPPYVETSSISSASYCCVCDLASFTTQDRNCIQQMGIPGVTPWDGICWTLFSSLL